jgi:hypothetical protein
MSQNPPVPPGPPIPAPPVVVRPIAAPPNPNPPHNKVPYSESRLKVILDIVTGMSTGLSGIAALAAILLSIHFYYLTDDEQTNRELYDTYRAYTQMLLEHPNDFKNLGSVPAASFVSSSAERIFIATDDKGWRKTVSDMLWTNKELLESIKWDCETMNPDFRNFAQNEPKVVMSCEPR